MVDRPKGLDKWLAEQGLVVRPKKPTEFMLSNARRKAELGRMCAEECWAAMIEQEEDENAPTP